jgi:uncharacterized protein (TIGR01777 family)
MVSMSTKETVLITGGSGLVGARLSQLLLEAGYQVIHLGRKKSRSGSILTYQWDLKKGIIEVEALLRADHIVHLAGAGVVDSRWTDDRKKEIISSRVDSANLLLAELKKLQLKPITFVSASAVGYYGNTGSALVTEDAVPGNDFLAEVCTAWESAAKQFEEIGSRVVVLRTGIVLSTKGGALPKTAAPVKFGIGATLGDGTQYVPWIHIDDLCRQYIYAIQNEKMKGIYNATAPQPVTNKEFTDSIGDALGKKTINTPAPAFVLKLAMGEMAIAVLGGQRTSSMKIQEAGFTFNFPQVLPALKDVFERGV